MHGWMAEAAVTCAWCEASNFQDCGMLVPADKLVLSTMALCVHSATCQSIVCTQRNLPVQCVYTAHPATPMCVHNATCYSLDNSVPQIAWVYLQPHEQRQDATCAGRREIAQYRKGRKEEEAEEKEEGSAKRSAQGKAH